MQPFIEYILIFCKYFTSFKIEQKEKLLLFPSVKNLSVLFVS